MLGPIFMCTMSYFLDIIIFWWLEIEVKIDSRGIRDKTIILAIVYQT